MTSAVLPSEERLMFVSAFLCGALFVLFALIELFEKNKIRELFDSVEGVGETATPQFVPESVNL
jgi:hypothetical protein